MAETTIHPALNLIACGAISRPLAPAVTRIEGYGDILNNTDAPDSAVLPAPTEPAK